ncbi:soluble scavenger receptor cysteine-rich domain-containing SSC5D-like protein [Labeo rohita]|uniref:Soluble scavenger receptor cysteine-rich domain-containing SSC5D-like protein n=2 Tax=Labeo rohita TaxID=84645 RepID=A0A498MYU5_LABRO|nr:soluble scavenger receptor cysteine-rich domain-containing SSC5D-like protein [Labeo rohita]RXN37469.1 soluble scavenger receptor cysteine-rich domain-containing SSC5D-like protein [Labeo rohita]
MVKTTIGVNVNDPDIKNNLLQKIKNVFGPKVGWRIQPDKQIFHQERTTTDTVRRVVVRIMVKTKIGVNVNDPDIKNNLLEKIRNVVEGNEAYSVNWRIQPDEQVFHQQRTTTDRAKE